MGNWISFATIQKCLKTDQYQERYHHFTETCFSEKRKNIIGPNPR